MGRNRIVKQNANEIAEVQVDLHRLRSNAQHFVEKRVSEIMLRIEEASTPLLRSAAFQLRYDVYVKEQQKNYVAEDGLLFDEVDESAVLCILRGHSDEALGTVRISFADDAGVAFYRAPLQLARLDMLSAGSISISSRLVLNQSIRQGDALAAFVIDGYLRARLAGAHVNIGHCRPSLVPVFARFGYRRYGNVFVDKESGEQVPIILVGSDTEHLTRVKSPLLGLTKWFERDEASIAWARNYCDEKWT